MKLIRLKKRNLPLESDKKAPKTNFLSQIEKGLKDVSQIQAGKIKPTSLRAILHEK